MMSSQREDLHLGWNSHFDFYADPSKGPGNNVSLPCQIQKVLGHSNGIIVHTCRTCLHDWAPFPVGSGYQLSNNYGRG